MAEVINEILKATKSDLEINHIKTGERYGNIYEDIPRRVPATDKAFKLLKWKAVTSMQDGINKTVDWTKKNKWYLVQTGVKKINSRYWKKIEDGTS